MPELPDVTLYVERLDALIRERPLENLRIASPFVLRSVSPRPSVAAGRTVEGIERIGKRIVFALKDDLFIVIHLMIAGRLRMRSPGAAVPKRNGLAAFDFENATFVLTEASTKKRASIHMVQGRDGLRAHDRGGLEVLEASPKAFAAALRAKNHTLKRALTDPRILSGIGNAYSDEILWAARLSPLKLTQKLTTPEMTRLHRATKDSLTEWTARFRREIGDGFPDKVTAFRPDMAVHGKYGEPCPKCGAKVQRIVYAENETNYCARCQNEGRLLKDRSLSRLLKDDWPRTVDELEH